MKCAINGAAKSDLKGYRVAVLFNPPTAKESKNPLSGIIPARQLIDSISQVAGWYKALISRAAAPPTPRAYQSAFSRIGIIPRLRRSRR